MECSIPQTSRADDKKHMMKLKALHTTKIQVSPPFLTSASLRNEHLLQQTVPWPPLNCYIRKVSWSGPAQHCTSLVHTSGVTGSIMSPVCDSSVYVRLHRKPPFTHPYFTTRLTTLHPPTPHRTTRLLALRSRIIWPLHLPYGPEPSRDAVQLHHTSRVHCRGSRRQDDSNDTGQWVPTYICAGMALVLKYDLSMYMRGNTLILSLRLDQGSGSQSPRVTETNANSTVLS